MPDNIQTKRCSTCKKIKPVSEFYRRSDGTNTLRNNCKVCKDAYATAYRQTPKGRVQQHETVKRYARSEAGKASYKRRAKQQKINNPNHVQARLAVTHAIEQGKILPARAFKCRDCDKQAEQYHHTLGYEPEHWLDVIPLCADCHKS